MKKQYKSQYSQSCKPHGLIRRSLFIDSYKPPKRKRKLSLSANIGDIFPAPKRYKIGYSIQEDQQFLNAIANDQPFMLPKTK